MAFKIGNGKLQKVDEGNTVEENNPFNDLVAQTNIQPQTIQEPIKQEQTQDNQNDMLKMQLQMEQNKLKEMQEKYEQNQKLEEMRYMEAIRNSQQQPQQFNEYEINNPQMQPFKKPDMIVQIEVLMLENDKIILNVSDFELPKFLEDLNMAISENSTIRFDNIIINCRNIKYYKINYGE